MYAVVEIKGKQYKVTEDSVITVDHIDSEAGAELEIPRVLLVRTEKDTKIGTPYVEGVTVNAVVEDHGRDSKVVVFKNKRRKNYRRTYGHRQQYSRVRVKEISGVA